jgi:hypothetical protein
MLSKTYRQLAKGFRIPAAALCWLVALTLSARAQEPTYSANSLMTTFDNGRINLKGTEIAFRDVVAESRTSKVIFKSSQSDRVICELVPPAQYDTVPAVGSMLTVKGRVRGRGLLGNVTLDDCSIAPTGESTITPEPSPQRPLRTEPEATAGPTETLQPASLPDRARLVAKPLSQPASAPRPAVAPAAVKPTPSVPATHDLEGSIKPSSDSQPQLPYGLYFLIFLSGAAASLIVSKLLSPAAQVPRPPVHEKPPQIRQAALETLLLKAEKKK